MENTEDILVEGSDEDGYAAIVRDDWKNREFVETIQVNVMKLIEFLNHFDKSARFKLANLNEKLSKLERINS